MSTKGPPRSRRTGPLRQLALAVLFVLQAAITLSPLLEATERGRMGAHMEQQGARHKYQHDDATCAVCAVRSLHSSPAQACAPIACERQLTKTALDAPASHSRDLDPTSLPRAPPRLT
jgi:hypothetical protein